DLNLPSPTSKTFTLGTATLLEPNAHSGIVAAETDNLGVTASLTFLNPLGAIKSVTATGAAVTGSVSDSFVDYTLTWSDVDVDFGNYGLFRIHLNDVSLSTNATGSNSANISATISLLRDDGDGDEVNATDVTTAAVPEPATAL